MEKSKARAENNKDEKEENTLKHKPPLIWWGFCGLVSTIDLFFFDISD